MTEAWKTLLQCLPTLPLNSEAWWQLTGKHLAAIVEAAAYPIEKQLEALLFHYHWTVPYMGQAPAPGLTPNDLKWKSLLGLDGTPIEYSWKWNTSSPTSKPNIRYVVEPIGEFAGTALDPLNQQASREILHRLAAHLPGLDNSWADHFFSTLYDHDNQKFMAEAARGGHLGTSVQLAVEFHEPGPALKTYFFPRRYNQGGLMPLDQWQSSINELQWDPEAAVFETAARTAVDNFLATSSEGQLLTPISLAIDNVTPQKSRLKWYFHTVSTSFASVRDIMTLGGTIANPKIDSLLDELNSLVKVVNGVPDDFPEDAEAPAGRDLQANGDFGELSSVLKGYLYYFDIAPGKVVPEIKLFVPTRYYGRDDESLGEALTKWMEQKGRGLYFQQYLAMLQSLCEHRGLNEGKGIQTYVSCLFKKGELDVTTYLGAEAYHPARLEKKGSRRGTLSRDDFY